MCFNSVSVHCAHSSTDDQLIHYNFSTYLSSGNFVEFFHPPSPFPSHTLRILSGNYLNKPSENIKCVYRTNNMNDDWNKKASTTTENNCKYCFTNQTNESTTCV